MAPNAALVRALLAVAVCLLLALGDGQMLAEAQAGGDCPPQLNRLLACRPFMVPGAPDPSPECCSALSSISHDCACSTMGIINGLPSRCHMGQVDCSA